MKKNFNIGVEREFLRVLLGFDQHIILFLIYLNKKKFNHVSDTIILFKNRRKKRRYVKSVEKDMKSNYYNEVKMCIYCITNI